GTFSQVYPAYRSKKIALWSTEHSYETAYPENILLQAAAELGFTGLGLFILVFAVFLRRATDYGGFMAGFLSLVCVNMAGVDVNYVTSSFMMAALAGLALRQGNDKRLMNGRLLFAALAFLAAASAVYAAQRHASNLLLKQAVYYSKKQAWKDAINCYEMALDKDTANLEARYFLAASYFDSGISYEKSMANFMLLKKAAPHYVLSDYYTGRIYEAAGNTTSAAISYEKMLSVDPYFVPSVVALSRIYASTREGAGKAERLILKAMEKYPDEASLYGVSGNVYFMAGRFEDAVRSFKKAVDLREDKDYYYNLGCAYMAIKDMKNSVFYLEKALKIDPKDGKVREMLRKLKAGN
ncbi:MAG TPA: tetratricopeptide repeat protein, partial [Candidatus Goldiibacteriota bacterium]|nr:tetratricopeptide repeat protein [Candidatus Goldiibacteriota bacterium]